MKQISEGVYERGKRGTLYVRRRIPINLRAAYPPKQTHVTRSVGATDSADDRARARLQLVEIDAEFAEKRNQLNLTRASQTAKRVRALSGDQLNAVAGYWVRQVLLGDDHRRQQGLDDAEFDDLGEQLATQRKDVGRMLAQGRPLAVLPALKSFLFLCGLDFNPHDEQHARNASKAFLQAVITSLDHQLARHRGEVVATDTVAPETPHLLHAVIPESAPDDPRTPTWDVVFDTWSHYVENRPRSTVIAYQTPWKDLRRFAKGKGVTVTPQVSRGLMTAFVQSMHQRNLSVTTINERLSKIRSVFKIACRRDLLSANPAAETLGFKENNARKRRKRRLPFDARDLNRIFGSQVFVEGTRSRGQSGEASYWLPVIMYYTGARREEVAGLALSDLQEDEELGWYFDIVDRPSAEDEDLFDDDVPESHRRTVKTGASVRRVPVAAQLIDLGLLRYVEWLQAQGATMLFPTLQEGLARKAVRGVFEVLCRRAALHSRTGTPR